MEITSSASQVGPNTALICVGPSRECFHGVLAVVEDDARVGVVDPVVDVVALLAVPNGGPDHLRDGIPRGGNEKTAGLREDLDILRERAGPARS